MLKKLSLITIAALVNTQAFAHAGHDHSAWNADLIHILTYAAIVGAVAAISYAVVKKVRKSKAESQQG